MYGTKTPGNEGWADVAKLSTVRALMGCRSSRRGADAIGYTATSLPKAAITAITPCRRLHGFPVRGAQGGSPPGAQPGDDLLSGLVIYDKMTGSQYYLPAHMQQSLNPAEPLALPWEPPAARDAPPEKGATAATQGDAAPGTAQRDTPANAGGEKENPKATVMDNVERMKQLLRGSVRTQGGDE